MTRLIKLFEPYPSEDKRLVLVQRVNSIAIIVNNLVNKVNSDLARPTSLYAIVGAYKSLMKLLRTEPANLHYLKTTETLASILGKDLVYVALKETRDKLLDEALIDNNYSLLSIRTFAALSIQRDESEYNRMVLQIKGQLIRLENIRNSTRTNDSFGIEYVESSSNEGQFFRQPFNVRYLIDPREVAFLASTEIKYISQKDLRVTRKVDELPKVYQHMFANMQKASFGDIILGKFDEIILIVWKLPNTRPGLETHFPIFHSKTDGQLLCSGDPDCFPAYGFISNPKVKADSTITIDMSEYTGDVVEIAGESLLISGSTNFGHWLAESLAHMRALDHITTVDKIITTKLEEPFQRNTIDLCSMTYPTKLSLIEACSKTYVRVFKLKNCWKVLGQQLPDAYAYLRRTFRLAPSFRKTKANPNVSVRSQNKKAIYLSRSDPPSARRVKNDAEIQAALALLDIKSIYPDKYNPLEVVDLLADVDLVICAPGATMFNYFAFGHSRSYFLNLYPRHLFRENLGLEKHIFWHLPYLSNVSLFLGDQVDTGSNTGAGGMAVPCKYSITTLVSFILDFKKRSEADFSRIPVVI